MWAARWAHTWGKCASTRARQPVHTADTLLAQYAGDASWGGCSRSTTRFRIASSKLGSSNTSRVARQQRRRLGEHPASRPQICSESMDGVAGPKIQSRGLPVAPTRRARQREDARKMEHHKGACIRALIRSVGRIHHCDESP
mmetsp:Transcript_44281/g.84669  ORF Transcript_44281/g.84669 Transcript_44281/m.84669 type:complete len:142 (+) Transcript_44281:3414-3839(+)